ncbi:hypothetical protein DFA_10593 [Cavenderia fasciculata]|uniref:Serine-threonine kinase receptor-associated protein n=1 Tax=Cavenderia fasciculata TaxID=261658 RepID=F4QAN1_CACFS|nr:uncharacterized protein DFA_10593 [Cavenderia fasciculata]EGG15750.1 hypothetical protein DFA_10593 [Cavenderia fasciculata]|eukprot:XP_004354497.1 hypothetical protein DFA_10593 [Cavenderia fasciculata]
MTQYILVQRRPANTNSVVVAIAPIGQGDRLFVASHDENVSQWDTSNGLLVNKFTHPDSVGSISITQDSRYMVSTSRYSVYLWGTAVSVTPLFTLTENQAPGHAPPQYTCVSWSPSNKQERIGHLIVEGSACGRIKWTRDQSMVVTRGGIVRLYENNTWRFIRSFSIGRSVNDTTTSSTTPPMIAFATGTTPDYSYSRRDKQDDLQFNIRLFNLDNTQQVAEIKGHDDPSYSISFSPDNKSIAIGGNDGYVIINQI